MSTCFGNPNFAVIYISSAAIKTTYFGTFKLWDLHKQLHCQLKYKCQLHPNKCCKITNYIYHFDRPLNWNYGSEAYIANTFDPFSV
jgi:hypothetical protein